MVVDVVTRAVTEAEAARHNRIGAALGLAPVVVGWVALSVPIALLVGRALRRAAVHYPAADPAATLRAARRGVTRPEGGDVIRSPLNEDLRQTARDMLALRPDDLPIRSVAQHLLALADGGPVVVLPRIDPARDDLSHWHGLDRDRLTREAEADAWNLAAGVFAAQSSTVVGARTFVERG